MDKMPHFQGKNYWAVILGGSSGFGWATAQKLAAEGMNLCILHRDRRQHLAAIEDGFSSLKALGVQVLHFNLDATRPDKQLEVVEVLESRMQPFGKVKLLLHAIAKGNLKKMADNVNQTTDFQAFTEDEDLANSYHSLAEKMQATFSEDTPVLSKQDFEITLQNMALSFYDWTQLLLKNNLFAPDARLIGLTSEGSQKSWRGYAAVSAAKSTLESLCRSMALEFAAQGLRCNLVQPGVTESPSLALIPGSDHLKMNALVRNPFGRLTQAEDVADVIYLLCRNESRWINGAIIPVDGGERNS